MSCRKIDLNNLPYMPIQSSSVPDLNEVNTTCFSQVGASTKNLPEGEIGNQAIQATFFWNMKNGDSAKQFFIPSDYSGNYRFYMRQRTAGGEWKPWKKFE